MKQYEKLTGVEYLNVQVAGTSVYRYKLGAMAASVTFKCATTIAVALLCPDSQVSRDSCGHSRASFTELQFQLHRWHMCGLAVWRSMVYFNTVLKHGYI
jgi:hypothetical protein